MSWCQWIGLNVPNSDIEELMDTLSWCHQAAAMTNQNASVSALRLAAAAGASFESSVASALLTLGGKHGPVGAARSLIYHDNKSEIVDRLDDGEILPGWGNSFYKTSIDPAFAKMDHLIREKYSGHHEKITAIGDLIFKVKGKAIYPNAAAFTAVSAEIMGMIPGTETLLFIACRLPAWGRQYTGARS